MTQTSLGHKLRVLRAERGLTLREAASRTGVAKETISDIERGTRHPHDVTLSKLAKGYGVPVEGLLEEPVPLAEAPEEAGPARKPLAHLYDGARKGIETFCDHWEHLLEVGDLNRQSLEELRIGIDSFNPVVDALAAAELRELSRRHHEVTGEPLEYGPLALHRKFGKEASLAPAVDRYIGVCLKAMRARAREAGADPKQDAVVVTLEEFQKARHSRAS
jgi:transcriptional regulator with XRE-family HTH domain